MLVILSMHRSGSSLLTGLLADNGFCCGDEASLVPPADHNPKGFWELDYVNAVNERLISSPNNSHLVPRVKDTVVADGELREEIKHAAKLMSSQNVTLVKDPRFCLTLEQWKPFLPELKVVLLHRNPLEVAESLQARHQLPIVAGLALWEFYTRSAVKVAGNLDVKIVSFDELIVDAGKTVLDIANWYSGDAQINTVETDFFDGELVHNKVSTSEQKILSDSQNSLHQQLMTRSIPDLSKLSPAGMVSSLQLLESFVGRGYEPVLGRLLDQQARELIEQMELNISELKARNAMFTKHVHKLLGSRGVAGLNFLYTVKNKLLNRSQSTSIDHLRKILKEQDADS